MENFIKSSRYTYILQCKTDKLPNRMMYKHTDLKVPCINQKRTKVPCINWKRTKVPCINQKRTKVSCINRKRTKVPCINQKRTKVSCINQKRTKVPCINRKRTKVPCINWKRTKVPCINQKRTKQVLISADLVTPRLLNVVWIIGMNLNLRLVNNTDTHHYTDPVYYSCECKNNQNII